MRWPSSASRIAAVLDVPLDDVRAVLADLIASGVVEEVPDRHGRPRYVFRGAPSPAASNPRCLSDGERIAAGLGTSWDPLPMFPGVSPTRRSEARREAREETSEARRDGYRAV